MALQETSTDADRWSFERGMREREVALAEQRLAHDLSMAKPGASWASPLVVAVFAAAVAAAGNAVVTYVEGNLDRALEVTKAEHARIQEMLATGDPDTAAQNLQFLVDVGLISNAGLRNSLTEFLDGRQVGEGPVLASVVPIVTGRDATQRLGIALSRLEACGDHPALLDGVLGPVMRACVAEYLGVNPNEAMEALDRNLGLIIAWIETGAPPPGNWRAQLGL